MALRIGPGPVFFWECLTAARRWQTYALRCVVIGVLLIALTSVWALKGSDTLRLREMAEVGAAFFTALISTQLTLILLAAPAATAGAVCIDKARGTLLFVFTTDLSNAEVILGKYLARLLPVMSLLACSLPVLLLSTWLGGIDPFGLVGAYMVMAGVALVGTALALLLSVWGRKAHEVLLGVYFLWAAALLAYPMWDLLTPLLGVPPLWLRFANPYWLALDRDSGFSSADPEDYATFLGVCAALALVAVLIAILRVRAVTLRQTGQPERRSRWARASDHLRGYSWGFGPQLDKNPVLWREWHRGRIGGWSWWAWVGFWAIAVLANLMILCEDLLGGGRELPPWTGALQASFGLLFVTVRAVTMLTEERTRGSLDILLTTPLTTASILWGKWLAAYRQVVPLAFLGAWTCVASSVGRRPLDEWLIMFVCFCMVVGLWGLSRLVPSPWSAVPRLLAAFLFVCCLCAFTNVMATTGLVVVVLLVYGAAYTSLGLAVATHVERAGRALGIAVGAYLAVTIGLLILVLILGLNGDRVLLGGSSFYAAGALTEFASHTHYNDEFWESIVVIWLPLHALAAVGLYWYTWFTFDRCLGRITLVRRPYARSEAALPLVSA